MKVTPAKKILRKIIWKWQFISLCIAITITCTLTAFRYMPDKGSALVEQKDGYYIFMFSQPQWGYEVMGSVKKTGIVLSGSPEEMFNTILRRCKKQYPKADGIIFTSVDMEHADCIKFKE